MTAEEIKNLASLAAISITDRDTDRFAAEFAEILGYVQKIKDQEAGALEAPVYHTETLRPDSPLSLFEEDVAEAMLNQAPRTHNRYIQVQTVLKK